MIKHKLIIQHCCQLLGDMLIKRKFRAEVIMKSIDFMLKGIETSGKSVVNERTEFDLVRNWLLQSSSQHDLHVDVLVYRLFRAIPLTIKAKRYLIKILRSYDPNNNKKWRSVPKIDHISVEVSKNAERHIEAAINLIIHKKTCY